MIKVERHNIYSSTCKLCPKFVKKIFFFQIAIFGLMTTKPKTCPVHHFFQCFANHKKLCLSYESFQTLQA